MKTQRPDGEEFVIDITEKAVAKNMVSQNPLIIIDAITLDNKEIEKVQYSILYKEDVQTVDVLDAEKAVPIYGDKGKNGLILVTRKDEKQKYLKHYLKRNMRRASR